MNLRIVVSDEREANFFDTSTLTGPLTGRGSIQNGAAGLKDSDLETDRPGRRHNGVTGVMHGHSHGVTGEKSTERHDVELFAKAVAQRIDADRNKNDFDKLLLIAPPRMLGLLRQSLSTHARALLAGEVSKDLIRQEDEAILKFIPDGAFFQPRSP
ncbi:host attachment protein [Povalibacter sp.]|uniref:host attachment protein n=1 Tax=Povalibacter sp. TaxID=1962978 RepID=UPI002F3F5B93